MVIEKAGSNTAGPDENLLMTYVDAPPIKSVTVDGKTVESKFNPVTVPSKFPKAHVK